MTFLSARSCKPFPGQCIGRNLTNLFQSSLKVQIKLTRYHKKMILCQIRRGLIDLKIAWTGKIQCLLLDFYYIKKTVLLLNCFLFQIWFFWRMDYHFKLSKNPVSTKQMKFSDDFFNRTICFDNLIDFLASTNKQ